MISTEKEYNNAVFSFAMKNKINSKEAEESFLNAYNFEKPETEEDKKQILSILSMKNILVGGFDMMRVTKDKLFIFNILSSIFMASFFTMFLIGKFVDERFRLYMLIPVLLVIITAIVKNSFDKKSKENCNTIELAEKEYQEFLRVSEPTKKHFISHIKSKMFEGLEDYKYIVKYSIYRPLKKNRFVRLLSNFKTLMIGSLLFMSLIPVFNKTVFFEGLRSTVFSWFIYINLFLFVLNGVISLIAYVKYKKTVDSILGKKEV